MKSNLELAEKSTFDEWLQIRSENCAVKCHGRTCVLSYEVWNVFRKLQRGIERWCISVQMLLQKIATNSVTLNYMNLSSNISGGPNSEISLPSLKSECRLGWFLLQPLRGDPFSLLSSYCKGCLHSLIHGSFLTSPLAFSSTIISPTNSDPPASLLEGFLWLT